MNFAKMDSVVMRELEDFLNKAYSKHPQFFVNNVVLYTKF